jgi:hypothetical protein
MGSGLIAGLLLTAVTVPQVQSAPAMPCPERAVRGRARSLSGCPTSAVHDIRPVRAVTRHW